MGTEATQQQAIKKALVTGGGGFVGKAIVKRLLDLGIDTQVVGRHRYPEVEKAGAKCLLGDISDPLTMARATKGVDIVFHIAALAGIWGPWKDYYRTNVLGTENVIESCQTNGVTMLVYTSTPSVVFNGKDILGADEHLEYSKKPLCHYATSKILAEKKVLDANSVALKTCALRPHLIWGPGDPHLLPRLLASGKKKQLKIVGNARNLVDITYIDNVAHAHILAADNLGGKGTASGQAYFISQGEPVNLWDWINALFGEMAIDQLHTCIPRPLAYAVGGISELLYTVCRCKNEPRMTRFVAEQLAKSHFFSIEKARKDLGYEPLVSIEEGLLKTIQWLKG